MLILYDKEGVIMKLGELIKGYMDHREERGRSLTGGYIYFDTTVEEWREKERELREKLSGLLAR